MADTSVKPFAIIAGVAVFALIIIAFSEVPAWVFIVPVLILAAVCGNGMSLDDYASQYDQQKARAVARNIEEHKKFNEEAEAIRLHGIYIKPEARQDDNGIITFRGGER